ncbi:hypothetical protein T11_17055 [Trichinella zimbabwensis]|uniref:Uncharacterized protein n=1 Tax=Trichinella zimbabwensis TaxID=268475 RepID=A0A0V1I037_9BILA|nr:hypothetical protein T11_17055 [Trichinella zimbabwensis]
MWPDFDVWVSAIYRCNAAAIAAACVAADVDCQNVWFHFCQGKKMQRIRNQTLMMSASRRVDLDLSIRQTVG